ncbi:MAG: PAS domain S-box protein [Bacteroidia bacterium]
MDSYFLEINYNGIIESAYSSFTELEDIDIVSGKHFESQQIPIIIKNVINEFIHGNQKYKIVKNLPVSGNYFDLKLIDKDENFVCILNHVTTDVNIKTELETNKNAFRALVDSTFDIIWSFNTEFKLTAGNKAFFELRKRVYNSNIVIGDNIFKDVKEEAKLKWLPVYQKVLDEGLPIKFEDKRWVGEEESFVVISLNPIRDEKGKIIGCMGITHDITPIKKQEEILREHNYTLQKIAGKLSHDFTQPIQQIREILMQGQIEDLTPGQINDYTKLVQLTDELQSRLEQLKKELLQVS